MKGQDIMHMLELNQRLDSPEKCPQPSYDIMLRCWSWKYVHVHVHVARPPSILDCLTKVVTILWVVVVNATVFPKSLLYYSPICYNM